MEKFSESCRNLRNITLFADNPKDVVLHDLEHLLSYKDASKIYPIKFLVALLSHRQPNIQVTPTHSLLKGL